MMGRSRIGAFMVLVVAVATAASLPGCVSGHETLAWWNTLRGDPYPLDEVSRYVDFGERPRKAARVDCSETLVTRYVGEHVRYERPVRIAESFQPKLQAFEAIVDEVAREYYGRAPHRILHLGAFACRTVRGRSNRLSEHALGNAIDVSGFTFTALRKNATAPEDLPAKLRRPFAVSVRRHFRHEADEGADALHRQFLRTVVARVRAERVFRGIIGPGRRGHDGHLHFDYGRWTYAAYARRGDS
jgi:hypothetical protein